MYLIPTVVQLLAQVPVSLLDSQEELRRSLLSVCAALYIIQTLEQIVS